MGLIGGAVTVAYFIGKMRAHNSATRDAVIDHYMEMHPDDFERTNDCLFIGEEFPGYLYNLYS
jgi:hypothetical protein